MLSEVDQHARRGGSVGGGVHELGARGVGRGVRPGWAGMVVGGRGFAVFIVSIIFLVLSVFGPLANISGIVGAYRNKKRGIDKGYSCAPLISLVPSLISWLTGREWLGLWPFLPTIIDPGTWMLLYLPWGLVQMSRGK